jgi:hypothetical protein
MAEMVERVARLEERQDSVAAALGELKLTVSDLDSRMQAGFAELRADMRSESVAVRSEFASLRAEMSTQFRWILGGIGSAAIAILIAVLTAILAKG